MVPGNPRLVTGGERVSNWIDLKLAACQVYILEGQLGKIQAEGNRVLGVMDGGRCEFGES